jgi:hypothetical protein
MPDLNIRKVGDGPRCYAVWLDHWPVFLDGLEGLPHIGDRFEIDGQLWHPLWHPLPSTFIEEEPGTESELAVQPPNRPFSRPRPRLTAETTGRRKLDS